MSLSSAHLTAQFPKVLVLDNTFQNNGILKVGENERHCAMKNRLIRAERVDKPKALEEPARLSHVDY